MAISQITTSDNGASARTKINAAIAEANKVAGKAEQAALTAETAARGVAVANEKSAREAGDAALLASINTKASQTALNAEATARAASISSEASARIAGDGLRVTYAEASAQPIRPGEAHRFFTADTDGRPDAVSPLEDAAKAVTPDGSVAQISGAGAVAPIAAWRIEPGRHYRVRFVVRRAVDTDDPANDAIRLGLRWLKADKAGLSTTILADLVDIYAANGRLEFFFNLATQAGEGVDAAAPTGGVYVRPFVKAYGSGITHVEVIEIVDLFDAIEFGPDVAEYRRELAGFNHRLESFADRLDVSEENIDLSRHASWFTQGTLDDDRLSDHVPFTDADETITGEYTFEGAARMLAPLYFGLATGGAASARFIADGNYFAIAPTDKAGGFNTLRELSFNPDATNPHWKAEGEFETTGALIVGDAEGSRENLDVYSQGETDAKDAALQGNIDAEADARIAGDTLLQDNVDAESAARGAADTLLQEAIDAEADARTAADSALQDDVDLKAPLADPAFTGTVTLPTAVVGAFPVFADDAAAGTGGLATGQIYATATGELRVKL